MNNDRTMLKARLVSDVEYDKDGVKVVVKKNTTVLVDVVRGFAKANDSHFDIFTEEFILVK